MPIIDISSHKPSADDIYFLDCNILMYMFYPNGEYRKELVEEYSSTFSEILSKGATLIITDVLISEFVNTYTQIEFHRLANLNGWSHGKKYFKNTFKFTDEYEKLLKEIKLIVLTQIKPCFTMVDTKFSEMDFNDFFSEAETFDFNDRYYGFCMNSYDNAYIISNDADFSSVNECNIITRNADLLAHVD